MQLLHLSLPTVTLNKNPMTKDYSNIGLASPCTSQHTRKYAFPATKWTPISLKPIHYCWTRHFNKSYPYIILSSFELHHQDSNQNTNINIWLVKGLIYNYEVVSIKYYQYEKFING